MNFIELLNYLQPYFRSVRKIKQFFSIDLLFPQTWKFPNEILEKVKDRREFVKSSVTKRMQLINARFFQKLRTEQDKR